MKFLLLTVLFFNIVFAQNNLDIKLKTEGSTNIISILLFEENGALFLGGSKSGSYFLITGAKFEPELDVRVIWDGFDIEEAKVEFRLIRDVLIGRFPSRGEGIKGVFKRFWRLYK